MANTSSNSSDLLRQALDRVIMENRKLGINQDQGLDDALDEQQKEAEERKSLQEKSQKDAQKRVKDEYLKKLREQNKQRKNSYENSSQGGDVDSGWSTTGVKESNVNLGQSAGEAVGAEGGGGSGGVEMMSQATNGLNTSTAPATEPVVGAEGGMGSGGAEAAIQASGEGIGEGVGGGAGGAGAGAGAGAGGGGGGGAGAGLGAGYVAAIIAAVTAAQHYLSNETDTKVEGVRSDDAFGGHFGTQPYQAYAYQQLGMPASSGERFDAAVENSDWGTALERLPDTADYWANPMQHSVNDVMYEGAEKNLGEDSDIVLGIFDPVSWVLRWLAGETD